MSKYTTYGHVRGHCGHHHRYPESAEACRHQDEVSCRRAGGYSDRRVCEIVDGYLRHPETKEYVYPSHGRSTGAVRA